MSSVPYKALSTLLAKFKDAEEDLYEEFRSSDISWGSEKQLTLANADYIHDIIDEYLQGRIADLTEQGDIKDLGTYQGYLNFLQGVKTGNTLYYCMEE